MAADAASLGRPSPVPDFRFVDAVLVSVADVFADLIFHLFLDVRSRYLQFRNAIDSVDYQAETVHLVADREFERGIDIPLLLVAADMEIIVVRAPVRQLVNQPGVSMEIENDRFVDREEGVEVPVCESVGMLTGGLQPE